jgi:hypothetical protein
MTFRSDSIYNSKLISRANRLFIMAYSIVATTAKGNTTNLLLKRRVRNVNLSLWRRESLAVIKVALFKAEQVN